MVPTFNITLTGAGGISVPLATPGMPRPGGVTLMELPNLDFLDTKLLTSRSIGQVGETVVGRDLEPTQRTLKCKITGGDVRKTMGAFLDLLAGECSFKVQDGDSVRWSMCNATGISQPKWGGSVASPATVQFDVILAFYRPTWLSALVSRTVTALEAASGKVTVAGFGDRAVWPVIKVPSNNYTALSIGWGGNMVNLPPRTGGYRINTDPSAFSITSAIGGPQITFTGQIPHFPTPPQPVNGQITLDVTATGATGDIFTIEAQPEWGRAW